VFIVHHFFGFHDFTGIGVHHRVPLARPCAVSMTSFMNCSKINFTIEMKFTLPVA